MRHAAALVALAGALCFAGPATAQSVAAGAPLFETHCARCHGPEYPAMNLANRVTYPFSSFEFRLRNPPEAMPRFSTDRVSRGEACSLYLYVRSRQAAPPRDSPETCGIVAPTPVSPPARASPGLPPAPPVSAVAARAFLFPPPEGDTFILDCWGGRVARLEMRHDARVGWIYEAHFTVAGGQTPRGEPLPWSPGQCTWHELAPALPPPPSSRSGVRRFVLQWTARDPTPFVGLDFSYADGEPRSAFATGGTQVDFAQILDAVRSDRRRVRFRISNPRPAGGASPNIVMDVHGFAIGAQP